MSSLWFVYVRRAASRCSRAGKCTLFPRQITIGQILATVLRSLMRIALRGSLADGGGRVVIIAYSYNLNFTRTHGRAELGTPITGLSNPVCTPRHDGNDYVDAYADCHPYTSN